MVLFEATRHHHELIRVQVVKWEETKREEIGHPSLPRRSSFPPLFFFLSIFLHRLYLSPVTKSLQPIFPSSLYSTAYLSLSGARTRSLLNVGDVLRSVDDSFFGALSTDSKTLLSCTLDNFKGNTSITGKLRLQRLANMSRIPALSQLSCLSGEITTVMHGPFLI